MNIMNELIAGHTIPPEKINVRFFIVKNRIHSKLYSFICGDPSLVIPYEKTAFNSGLSEEQSGELARTLFTSPGYKECLKTYKQQGDCFMKVFASDNNIERIQSATTLEELQAMIDSYTIGYSNVKGAKLHVVDITKLEMFDMSDPDVIAKACA